MAEIVFDAFNPNDACLQAPKPHPQPDACRIEGRFHVKAGNTPENPSLFFKREGDRFVLETTGNEVNSGLVRGLGFSEMNPKIQGAIFYSVSFHRWIKETYAIVFRKYPGEAGLFLAFTEKFRNFLVLGSIQNPDPAQRSAAVGVLRELFQLTERQKKNWAIRSSEALLRQKGWFIPSMIPRIQWLVMMAKVERDLNPPLPHLSQEHPLRAELQAFNRDLLVYLGVGAGKVGAIQKRLDGFAIRQLDKTKASQPSEDLYGFYLHQLEGLKKQPFFQENPEGRTRLEGLRAYLKTSFEERRAELVYLGSDPKLASEAATRSLAVRLNKAAQRGDLGIEIRAEVGARLIPENWLSRRENLIPLAEAILSGISYLSGGAPNGRFVIDADKIRLRLQELFKTQGLQKRSYLLGALAMLRYLFGKGTEATTLRAWVRDQYQDVRIDWVLTGRKEMQGLLRSLENRIGTSVKGSERVLPWVEGAICAAGLGLGGAGLGVDRRELTVSGSTVAGLGCGALISHFLFRKKNHYIVDSIGGALGAGLGFGLSFGLTKARMNPPQPPPPPPPPPPPQDPARRNPNDPYGP